MWRWMRRSSAAVVRDAFLFTWSGWLHTSEAASKIEVCQSSCATCLNPADGDEPRFHLQDTHPRNDSTWEPQAMSRQEKTASPSPGPILCAAVELQQISSAPQTLAVKKIERPGRKHMILSLNRESHMFNSAPSVLQRCKPDLEPPIAVSIHLLSGIRPESRRRATPRANSTLRPQKQFPSSR